MNGKNGKHQDRAMSLKHLLRDDVARTLDAAYFGVDFHYVSAEDLADRFGVEDVEMGLKMSVANDRLSEHGPNVIPSPNQCPAFMCCLLPWLKNTPAMIAYRDCIAESAQVLRDGKCLCVDPSSIVQGDVIHLEQHDLVPADCRILESDDDFCLQAFSHESFTLLGSDQLSDARSSFLASNNIIYGGCLVISGQCRAMVINAGKKTVMATLIEKGLWPAQKFVQDPDLQPLLPL